MSNYPINQLSTKGIKMKTKAIALYSGGMDSALAAFKAKNEYDITGAYFNVGQPGSDNQLASARRLAAWQGIHLEVFDLSSLKNNFLGLAPNNHISLSLSGSSSMNCPFGIFGLAASYAIACGASALISGVHHDDLKTSPHAREYLRNVGNDAAKLHNINFQVHLPLEKMCKADVVTYGASIDFPFEMSRSCSSGANNHCGVCDECIKRMEAFSDARVNDPVQYDVAAREPKLRVA